MSKKEIFSITETEFKTENNRHFEGAMCTGNGYLSVRASLEEGLENDPQGEDYIRLPANVTLEKSRATKSKWGTFIPGIMGKHPILKEEIINLPFFLGIKIWFDDEKLDMEKSNTSGYERILNLKNGELIRKFIWTTKKAQMEVCFERFISLAQNYLSVQKVTMKLLSGEGKLRIEAGIDARVRTNGYNHFKSTEQNYKDGTLQMKVVTDNNNEIIELSKIKSNEISAWSIKEENEYIAFTSEKHIKKDEELSIMKLVAVATDRDLESSIKPYDRANQTLENAYKKDFSELQEENNKEWQSKWDIADIKIDGDEEAQLAIRFSIYHLIRSNAENDPRVAICAKGHAGDAYFGRYFWDTEIFMLPFFLFTNPNAAKNLVLFRHFTLEGAKQNAKNYGYEGARYPWESSISGLEQCPSFQYADHEVHVTADVSYAIWNYYKQTGDKKLLFGEGIDILIETARYWAGRVDKESKTGEYNLIGVMGPDEYLPFTRNNAFTNNMVKFNLLKAVEVMAMLKIENETSFENKSKELSITNEELKTFENIGNSLKIPYDKQKELVLECEEFYEYADIDFDEIWTDRTKPFGHFISQEKNYRSKALKQADVLEMMRLFPNDYSDEQVKNAYDYYEPITTHDSSLSAATHGIIACRLNKMKEAEKFFRKTLGIDLSLDKKGAAEGIHIANCGGIWQLIVFGFAGLTIDNDELKINPKLPSKWNGLEFNVVFKGEKYNVKIGCKKSELIKL